MTVTTPDELIKPMVALVGEDGNAFSIMGRVQKALEQAGNSKEIVDSYVEQAMSGDYNHLLAVTLAYVNEGEEDE